MVLLYMACGAGTFDLLVPQDGSMVASYKEVRRDIAMPTDQLIPVTSTGQVCSKWGVHNRLAIVAETYKGGEAAFITNIGHLIVPNATRDTPANTWTCEGMGSHAGQMQAAQRVGCHYGSVASTGVGGRIADAVAAVVSPTYVVNSWSAAGSNVFGDSSSVKREIVGDGVKHFREYSTWQWELQNISTQKHANPYANVYTFALMDALQVPVTVDDLISSVGALKHTWGICIGVCAQFKAVAKLISARADRNVERDVFSTGASWHPSRISGAR